MNKTLIFTILFAAIATTGCGQRAQRTDLAIQPLTTPLAPSVLVTVKTDLPSDLGDGARAVGAGALTLLPIASAFVPSVGPTNQPYTNDAGVADREITVKDGEQTLTLTTEPAIALQANIVNELRKAKVFGAVYTSQAEIPDGRVPDVTITAAVRERTAMRFHHSGFGVLYYTPFAAILAHSTYSVDLSSDVMVAKKGTTVYDDTVSAGDAYRIYALYWQPSARREARTFARTVLATEVAQEVVAEIAKALAQPTK